MDAFIFQEHLFIYLFILKGQIYCFLIQSFFFYFFLILNTDFKNEHSRSAELGESRDFDDEDQSIFSLQTEPSNNMKSLVRVSLEMSAITQEQILTLNLG